MIIQLCVSAAPCMNPQSNPAELGVKKKAGRLREFHFQWCKTYKVIDLLSPTVTSGCYRFYTVVMTAIWFPMSFGRKVRICLIKYIPVTGISQSV